MLVHDLPCYVLMVPKIKGVQRDQIEKQDQCQQYSLTQIVMSSNLLHFVYVKQNTVSTHTFNIHLFSFPL